MKGELFEEISIVADYFQYYVDKAAYKEVMNKQKADINEQEELILNETRESFKRLKVFKLEASTWGWCPIWEVILGNEELKVD